MTTLAHISDIHLAPLPRVRPKDLVGKRITGYLNWKLTRKSVLSGESLKTLIDHLQTQNADFIAVTGDMVNLALTEEITRAGKWLSALGSADRICVSPGNHDAYVHGALEKAFNHWGDYITGETLEKNTRFPFVRRVGDIAVIACSSAVPTAPFLAVGEFGGTQATRLADILRVTREAGYFRVVMIHHPPNVELQHPSFGLRGHKLFRDIIEQEGCELVLHGHTHRSSIHSIHGPAGEVPVIGVAAASADQGGRLEDPARYNLFRVERNGSGWSCTMREFGYQRLGSDIVMRLQMRIY